MRRNARALRLFDPFGLLFDEDFGISVTPSAGFPMVNMYEQDNNLVIEAQLPGFSPDDVDVSIEEGAVKISGSKKVAKEDKDKRYYIKEITMQAFSRTIPLPKEVDVKKAEASFKDGVLVITLPKVEEKKALKIPIKIKK